MTNPDFDDFFDDPEETEAFIDYLVSIDAAIWDGMDEYGERMFKFNMPVLKEVLPELYEQVMGDVDDIMLNLFEKGLVDIEYDENLNALFHISEEGKKALQEVGIDYIVDDEE